MQNNTAYTAIVLLHVSSPIITCLFAENEVNTEACKMGKQLVCCVHAVLSIEDQVVFAQLLV